MGKNHPPSQRIVTQEIKAEAREKSGSVLQTSEHSGHEWLPGSERKRGGASSETFYTLLRFQKLCFDSDCRHPIKH